MGVELLTVREVAKELRASRASVYQMIGRRTLPHYRLGSSIRVSPAQLETFLERNAVDRVSPVVADGTP